MQCHFIACFFFKQKTAYEMRISDWSSDVCSSDLALVAIVVLAGHVHLPPARTGRQDQRARAQRGAVLEHDLVQPAFLGGGHERGRRLEVHQDRKSVVAGKSVSVRVDLGGRRIIKKKK